MAVRKDALGKVVPAVDAAAANLHDTNELTNGPCRGFMVGASGNVKIKTLGGNTVTLTAVAAGVVIPVGATQIFSTDTTATGIVVLY